MPPFTASPRLFFTAGRAELSRSPHNESSSARAHHSNPVCAALATRSAAHPIQDLDTGVPLSDPSGSSLPLYMHHVVCPRSLPAISRPRSSHGTPIPSGALRPPLFICCRPSSVERTADPSERVPIVPVIQGQTKNSLLPPSLQRPYVVLVTFEHFQLFYRLCFYNYFTMHFNVGFIVLSYFMSFDSCN